MTKYPICYKTKFTRIKLRNQRVLRIMRENHLLSPHRFVHPPHDHDGEIGTDKPNDMWGTDGTQVLTVEDGNVWIFTAQVLGHRFQFRFRS